MRLLLISLVLLTSGISQAATYYSIGNWNSNSSSSKWSTTQGGSNCGCAPNFATDDVYVYHKVRLRYGIQVTTGSFNVMDGAQVYLNQWGGSFSVGSSASLFIEDGGKLYTYASLNNQSDDFLVEVKFDMNGGSTITNSGIILVYDVAGRMVDQTTAIGNTVRFEGIETGIHIFQIQYADGSTEVQKYFVK